MLAFRNLGKLPELVGLMLQADGTFAVQMGRLPAVLAPLMVTAICLLLMFCSKRVLTPWLASVFSLVIPVVIWIINVYPI
jgi:predicted membrane protein